MYIVAPPELQVNVTLDEVKVDPGAGVNSCAAPCTEIANGCEIEIAATASSAQEIRELIRARLLSRRTDCAPAKIGNY